VNNEATIGARSPGAVATVPTQSTGHYSTDGTSWWDDQRQRWYRTTSDSDSLEITVEEIGQRSWFRALFSTLSGSYGSALFWFVGETPGNDRRGPRYRIVGDSFPVMRMQPFDELAAGGPFADEARNALSALHQRLTSEGWRLTGRGKHWYSHQYTRPRLDWASPPQPPPDG
jgi:hypothetical protein